MRAAWGWPVHLLIGDLDSLPAEDTAALAGAGVPILRAPAAKDETDLELALQQALAEDASQIVICGALGEGRITCWLTSSCWLVRTCAAGRR